MTRLESIYLRDLLKNLERTDEFCHSFTSNQLRKFSELVLKEKTLGGFGNVTRNEFHDAMEILGFRTRPVTKGSPYVFYNITVDSALKLFSEVMC